MSKIKTTAAIYVIVVGISIIGWWGFLLITGQMPEMESAPIAAWLHVAAEVSTGLALWISGAGLLQDRRWARSAFLASTGMLLYAVIQASGYFAQSGQLLMMSMFVVFFLLSLFFLFNSSRLESLVR